tara:strand:+ start:160 stop:642 length:483 start_codon:yes stop_codon:yes gene_type:complete
MTITFAEIIPEVLKREGGYVNDPTDMGGETRYGISKRSYPDIDIKELTVRQATDIYLKDYWIPSKAEKLPEDIRADYFDSVVNHGQGNAVKILQRAVNSTGSPKIAVDGRIGRNTIRESRRLKKSRFQAFRTLFYSQIIHKNQSQEKYWYGWFKRAIGIE